MKNLRLKPSTIILIGTVLTMLIFGLDKIIPDIKSRIIIKLILLLIGAVISVLVMIKSIKDLEK